MAVVLSVLGSWVSMNPISNILLLILVFFIPPHMALSLTFVKIPLPSGVTAAASIGFPTALPKDFYVSVQDGRILKYQAATSNFSDFATTGNRSKAVCDGQTSGDLEPRCGRPLSLEYNRAPNQLFIADAYYGILVAGTDGRLATQLASAVNGVPFRFINGLSLHPRTGDIYFTESGVNIEQAVLNNDRTGSLLKYDMKTKQVTVLLRGLSGAAGDAVNANGDSILVSELIGGRIQRFWLEGPQIYTAETLIIFPGRPNKIRRTPGGDFFWVAVNIFKPDSQETVPTRIRINRDGNIMEKVSLENEYNTTRITGVVQFAGASYYVASRYTNFVGLYKYT
ncbi:hypothetical protein F2P56_013049 [Juglans regia]|uniref:Strictosidine synthase conserved region domain-containing protein n=1 Tax=Juglans regia TaxID=51240 RepID=A0A833XJS3_JUGRE|nr:hypothetical protein F2P56_013049 [Juglans regia]